MKNEMTRKFKPGDLVKLVPEEGNPNNYICKTAIGKVIEYIQKDDTLDYASFLEEDKEGNSINNYLKISLRHLPGYSAYEIFVNEDEIELIQDLNLFLIGKSMNKFKIGDYIRIKPELISTYNTGPKYGLIFKEALGKIKNIGSVSIYNEPGPFLFATFSNPKISAKEFSSGYLPEADVELVEDLTLFILSTM